MNLGYEPKDLNIYIFTGYVDMRKQMNGLLSLVQGTCDLDPYTDALFVFTNKKKDKIKALKWDENGFVVYYNRLEKGAFRYPDIDSAENGKIEVSAHDLRRLLYGLEMGSCLKKRKYISM